EVTAGVPGTWQAANPLPIGVRRVTGVGVDDYVFVLGGTIASSSTENAIATVQVGQIDDTGQNTWDTPTNMSTVDDMPQARGLGGAAFHSAFIPEPPASADVWSVYE